MKNISCKVTIEIEAPAAAVWEALTKPELIKQYFFNTDVTTDWKVGDPITFRTTYEGKEYQDKGTVLEVNPNKILRYNLWSPLSGTEDKPENYLAVTYSITETKPLTILIVTQENIPDENMRAQSETNWKKVLAALKAMLEKQAEPAY
jgi:uncharacterized protein YndB with AHSA1/START domain